MLRKIKAVSAMIAAAGVAVGVMGQVPMQTNQDSVDIARNRLVINGQPVWISGINLAWNQFARDVGDTRISASTMTSHIKQIREAGGNAMRWWLHTDATHCPKFNGTTGSVTGLGAQSINNMRTVLDSAYKYGVVVSMCLFSFDILHNDGGNKTADQMTNNLNFMTVEANLDSYITNALRPILDAIGDHPAIMCWEVFNEPEGMAEGYGWSTTKIAHSNIIRFTAKIAGEVHRRTNKMASTGIHNFHRYVSLYTTPKLTAVDPDGWLDFYMAHHYPEYEAKAQSPFYNPASHWGYDRPVLIGEFPAQSWGNGPWGTGYPFTLDGPLNIVDAYKYAYDNGYLGAMSWSITEGDKAKFGGLSTTAPALTYMFENYREDIEIGSGVEPPPPLTGDLAMKIVFDAHGVGDDNESLFKKDVSVNLGGSTNFIFDLWIDPSSGSSLQLHPALQAGAPGWDWFGASAIDLGGYDKGEWVTVTVPLSSFGATSSASIQAIFLKFVASGSPFTGIIYIDNVRIDNTVVSDFNEAYSEWASAAGTAEASVAARPGSSAIVLNGNRRVAAGSMPSVTVRDRVLNVRGVDNSEISVRLVNMRGRSVANFTASGSARFSLSRVPAGRYLVETKVAGNRVGTTAVIVR